MANAITKGALIYEGKAKKVFEAGQPDHVIQYFKDDATAFNAEKRGTIVEKGVVSRNPDAFSGAAERPRDADEAGDDHPDRGGGP